MLTNGATEISIHAPSHMDGIAFPLITDLFTRCNMGIPSSSLSQIPMRTEWADAFAPRNKQDHLILQRYMES